MFHKSISLCASERIRIHLYAPPVTCRLLLCESLRREKEYCAGLRRDAREFRSYCLGIVRLRLRLHFQITVRADNIERDKSLSRGIVRRSIWSKYLLLRALFLVKTVEYRKAKKRLKERI